jgi:UDP-glucose 4-epimerase
MFLFGNPEWPSPRDEVSVFEPPAAPGTRDFGAMRYFVTGGAGFIGSHLVRRLLRTTNAEVVVYDRLAPDRSWRLPTVEDARRLRVVRGDLKDLDKLRTALPHGTDAVFHFASNPDIARAASEPDIDFWEGTYLTQNLLEAMRQIGVGRIIYASGSGVYGETGEKRVSETDPHRPISTYGASKLACEALIRSYCHLFGVQGLALRFANVVGPRQTHGVAFDFVRRLLRDPSCLRILGDGRQSKSYVHVDDVIDAMLLLNAKGWSGFDEYNVATDDAVTVLEIAAMCARKLGAGDVQYTFTGGDRGWKGDVPVIRFDAAKLRARGWSPKRCSAEALGDAIDALIADAREGRFDGER